MRLIPVLLLALFLAACAAEAPAPGDPPTPATPTASVEADPDLPAVTVYKTPTCGCCSLWVDHLEANGFPVEVQDVESLTAIKQQYGIPAQLQSCHTAVVDGYIVEGHVPAEDVKRLLAEQPEAAGLAVPGMPIGSPGMEVPGREPDRYAVYFVDDGEATVFAEH